MTEPNEYLGQVLQQQQRVDQELKRKVAAPAPSRGSAPMPAVAEPQGSPVGVRITGWWRWKTVVVPPNVYVVHTRRGRAQPMHIGMGISFGFDPYRDAFLAFPAAMQTILINARCICRERQGLLVQAYVQWIVEDVGAAYKRLDFSDVEDPMRIVNVQLREQAEAAVKDKVATMEINDVLADKQPIIEELTARLRMVAEGTGLKIVTVQIKEAVVSSTRLWENLQKPFRAERERVARLAELDKDRQLAERELEIRQGREAGEMAVERELDKARGEREREAATVRHKTALAERDLDLELALKTLEAARNKVEAQVETLAQERRVDVAEGARRRANREAELALEELASKARQALVERELAELRERRRIENELSDGLLRSRLIDSLPEIAAKLPAPKELRAVTLSGDGPTASLASLVAGVLAIVDQARPPTKG